MNRPPDYYNVLRIRPTASAEEIKHAYRRRAKETHPDSVQGMAAKARAEADFKSLNEAHAVLCDPARRLEYDRLRMLAARRHGQRVYRRTRRGVDESRVPPTHAGGRSGVTDVWQRLERLAEVLQASARLEAERRRRLLQTELLRLLLVTLRDLRT